MKMICSECRKEYKDMSGGTTVCPSCGGALTAAKLGDAPRVLISFLIFFMMIICVYLLSFSVIMKITLGEKNISAIADRTDITGFSANGLGIFSSSGKTAPFNSDIAEAIYFMNEHKGPDAEGLRTLYERGTFRSFVKEQLIGYGRFASSGEIPDALTAEKTKRVFDENMELINSLSETPLTSEDIAALYENIDSFGEFFAGVSPAELDRTMGGRLRTSRNFCSAWFPVLTVLILAVMFVLLIKINGSSSYALFWGGSAALFSGAGLLILKGTVSVFVNNIGENIIGSVLRCIAGSMLPTVHMLYLLIIAAGFAMIICASFIRRKQSGVSAAGMDDN